MGTRGSVAVRREDGGWQGVYNHWDSYPTGLGEDVFTHFRAIPQKYRQDACLKLLATDDWREYQNDGVCEYCGVAGLGQPHTIGGGHDENGVVFHKHTRDDGVKRRFITNEDNDPLFIEWVYIVDPFKNEIEVLTHTSREVDGSRREDGYTHVSVGTYPIDADFDAAAVEKHGYKVAGYGDDDEEDDD